MITKDEIAELRRLHEAATRGPWESLNGRSVFAGGVLIAELSREDEEGDGFPTWEEAASTTDLIVETHSALIDLLDAAENWLDSGG